MEGFLYVDKPEGWTSFDVVNYVRKMVANLENKKPRNVKVGHTGTLDPAATGLLVLCVGKNYTKKVPELIKQDKTYEVEITLGKTSTTADKEGVITVTSTKKPSFKEIEKAVESFIGEIDQLPPIYSAIKIDGKRAYDLARSGKKVEMQSRKVNIISIVDIRYEYPVISFKTRVGSGTYIRSLAVDIGEKLGTGAYMSNLKRTSIGDVTIEQALAKSDLTPENLQKILALDS
jgi:tRNA pseudouridine55 synthase